MIFTSTVSEGANVKNIVTLGIGSNLILWIHYLSKRRCTLLVLLFKRISTIPLMGLVLELIYLLNVVIKSTNCSSSHSLSHFVTISALSLTMERNPLRAMRMLCAALNPKIRLKIETIRQNCWQIHINNSHCNWVFYAWSVTISFECASTATATTFELRIPKRLWNCLHHTIFKKEQKHLSEDFE